MFVALCGHGPAPRQSHVQSRDCLELRSGDWTFTCLAYNWCLVKMILIYRNSSRTCLTVPPPSLLLSTNPEWQKSQYKSVHKPLSSQQRSQLIFLAYNNRLCCGRILTPSCQSKFWRVMTHDLALLCAALAHRWGMCPARQSCKQLYHTRPVQWGQTIQ